MRENQQDPKTPSQLRREIDAGEGRDKIAYPDPAAAPLGTDDEAAGTPVSDRQTWLAHQNEIAERSERDSHALPEPRARHGRGDSAALRPRLGLLILGLAVLAVILFVVAAFT